MYTVKWTGFNRFVYRISTERRINPPYYGPYSIVIFTDLLTRVTNNPPYSVSGFYWVRILSYINHRIFSRSHDTLKFPLFLGKTDFFSPFWSIFVTTIYSTEDFLFILILSSISSPSLNGSPTVVISKPPFLHTQDPYFYTDWTSLVFNA